MPGYESKWWMILREQKKSFADIIKAKFADVELQRSNMHVYQNEDVVFFKENPFSLGWIDIGMGKTVTAGTLIRDLLQNWDHDGKVLVVGPIPIVCSSWPDEFASWSHLAGLTYTVLREDDDDPRIKEAGRAARKAGANVSQAQTAMRVQIRQELARSAPDIHLISFEGLDWLVDFWKRKWPYRTVIVDEATLLKSHSSNRFNSLAMVRREGLITRMHLLTGSLGAEGYQELWAPTYLLDLGERFGKCITHFREQYFTQNPHTRKWKLRPNGEEEILAKLADIATIRKRKDYFDVKDAAVVQRKVRLTGRERELYDAMLANSLVDLDGKVIEAETAAALTQKLSQMASGVLYETELIEPEGYDPDSDELVKVKHVHHIHDQKIEMLKEIVAELDGENLLVSYQHRSSLDRLQKAFPKAIKWDKTGKSKEPWNAGKIPMLLMHPKSGGHGNNLQRGGHYIVFFDIPWSRDQFVQLIGRLDRQGQTHPVTVILLVAHKTIDEEIAKSQSEKKFNEEELVKILQRLIRARRRSLPMS